MGDSEHTPGEVAHSGSGGINIALGNSLNLNVWGYVRGERLIEPATPGDAWPKTDRYANINLNLRIRNVLERLEGYLTVYNLFDKAYATPGLHGLTIPARGRNIIGGVRYTF